MTRLDLKRILRRSLIRYLFAPLPPTVNVVPEVTPARRGYYSTDLHHVNIDAMGARGILEAFLGIFSPFLAPFLRNV